MFNFLYGKLMMFGFEIMVPFLQEREILENLLCKTGDSMRGEARHSIRIVRKFLLLLPILLDSSLLI